MTKFAATLFIPLLPLLTVLLMMMGRDSADGAPLHKQQPPPNKVLAAGRNPTATKLHAEPVVDFEDEENRDDEEDGG
jgi:hypothetical protein